MTKVRFLITTGEILLVILLALSLIPTARSQEGPIFEETFDDPGLPGWHPLPEGAHITDGYLRLTAPGFAVHDGDWKNVEMVFRLRRINPNGETIIPYRASGGQAYIFVLGSDFAILQIEQAGQVTDIESRGEITVPVNEWFDLMIFTHETEHSVTLNGEPILTVNHDTNLPGGGFSIEVTREAVTEIDHVLIFAAGDESAAPSPVDTTPSQDNQPEAAPTEPPVEQSPPPDTEPGVTLTDQTPGVWVRTGGPLGGLGYDIRMRPDNPDIMYVTDAWAGIFKSSDGGQTWFPSNNGITTRTGASGSAIPVFSCTIDPHNHDILWVGTQHTRGIFKSTDGGETWVEMDNGVVESDGITFRGFTVDPRTSDTVYAAAELSSWVWAGEERVGQEFDMTNGVVYRTTDGGQHWEAIWRGDNLARYVWVNPENPDIIYISTGIFDREAGNSDPETGTPGGVGIVKSTDGGQTWNTVNNGLNNLYVGTLFMHPEDPDILLAGTGNIRYPEFGGVYITTDGGASWQHTLEEGRIDSVEFSLQDPIIAYAGNDAVIYVSQDGGFTWERVTDSDFGWGPPGVRAGFPIDFQVDPRDPQRIFANNYGGGNFLSTDGGRTWVDASRGYTGAQVRDVAVDPSNPLRVFAAARSGIFRTEDGGSRWVGKSSEPVYSLEWYVVAVDPTDSQHILASNNWSGTIVQSLDGGESWQEVTQPAGPGKSYRAIIFAPSDPMTVYAGQSAFFSAGTFSDDMPAGGIYVSHDGGSNWQSINDANSQDANVTALAVHPTNPLIVYTATGNHDLLKTDDGGQTWQSLQLGLTQAPMALSVAVHPTQPNIVFAGLARAGLYRSTDDGQTWQPITAGLPPESVVSDIVFNPTNPQVMFITDRFSGVYHSVDGGQSWQLMVDGLRMRDVNSLSISGDGQYLYAGTEGEGVYRVWLGE